MPREPINEKLRQSILERDNYCCRYCGKTNIDMHIDHVYPVSKDGETSINNLVTSCPTCNLKKKDKIGIWPKPIGYFDNPHPTELSMIMCIFGITTVGLGSALMLVDNANNGFYILIFGLVLEFIGIHLKRTSSIHEN